ncbi:DUF3084 domain-containing protein [Sesbania bispinosa]|nr:DUF3084 domain-containing protein [Sesbania bispinosa]
MVVLANEEVANVHARVNFNQHLQVMVLQCPQRAAFMKYLRGTIVPHFQEVQSSNEELEKEVTNLEASIELVGNEMKKYKAQYETLNTTKDKADKSNPSLKAELKRVREDMALRTAEVEAAMKSTEDLRVVKEQVEKAGRSSAGTDRQVVANLVKNNLARHQAKLDEEKTKLVAIGNNLVKESFENSLAQFSLRNPTLVRDGVSHKFEVFRGQICKVDALARKLIVMDSEEEVTDWDEEGSYRLENELWALTSVPFPFSCFL